MNERVIRMVQMQRVETIVPVEADRPVGAMGLNARRDMGEQIAENIRSTLPENARLIDCVVERAEVVELK